MTRAPIGIGFLAYARHPQWQYACERFVCSYQRHPAGIDHRLYILFKGFEADEELREAQRIFAPLAYSEIRVPDEGFGMRAYALAAPAMPEDIIGFLNTKSEILCGDWLLKLSRPLDDAEVGLTGNTGSYESPTRVGFLDFPGFPNPHVRTNGFLMRASLFRALAQRAVLTTQLDGWKFESGWNSLSREVLRRRLKMVVVGRNGQAYAPREWPASNTYRSSSTGNVLIADDAYREFPKLEPESRAALMAAMWGSYLESPAADDDALFAASPLSLRGTLIPRTARDRPQPALLGRALRALRRFVPKGP